MNTKELEETATALGIEFYNSNEGYICLKGINGHASTVFTESGVSKHNLYPSREATLKDFAEHLKQMGRDSLKMDLNDLLSITKHF